MRESSTFGLSFQTLEEDGLLLLSTFQEQTDSSSSTLGDFYSVSMVTGNLHVVLSSSSDPGNKMSFVTEQAYNDGKLHTLVIIRSGERYVKME